MKILTGPFASGKSANLLSLLKDAAAIGPVRLFVPTATLAEHWRHMLVRERISFDPDCVTTLAAFIAAQVPEAAAPSTATLDFQIREALDRTQSPAFRSMRQFPGFRVRLRELLEEISATGTDAAGFEQAVDQLPFATPVHRAFAQLFAAVERELGDRGMMMTGARTLRAAARLRPVSPTPVFLDGFFSFSPPEISVLETLADRCPVALTLPEDWPGAKDFLERLTGRAEMIRTPPGQSADIEKVTAAGREQEAAEIVRRIAERLDRGEHASRIGIIVRGEQPYVPILKAQLARFGIPARFYFPERLEQQSPIRYLSAVIEALLDGWNWERLQDGLGLAASGLGAEADRLDFEIRAKRPGRGLEAFPLLEERYASLTPWAEAQRTPAAWAVALGGLSRMPFERTVIAPGSIEDAVLWRRRAESLRSWKAVIAEVAEVMPDREIPLRRFWDECRAAIALTAVRTQDARAECVHVVDAWEARQWRFDAVYVCGLLEGEFPRHPAADTLLDNNTRLELRRLGIPLRTSDDAEAVEQALLRIAATRSTAVTMSWPSVTDAGEPSLPAFALDDWEGEATPAPDSRLILDAVYRPPVRIPNAGADDIARHIREDKKWRPTEIECFLQCPFQYLGRHTLNLRPPPPDPAARFDARVQGTLAHTVLRRMVENPALDIEATLDEEFRILARTLNIAPSHLSLWGRVAMLRTLREYLAMPAEREGFATSLEWPFEYPLIQGIPIKGRIDRFDSKDGAAYAIDYKYSKPDRLKKSDAIQGGLYLLALQAAGYRPAGFSYVALRGAERVHFSASELMADAREKTIGAVTRIRAGECTASPADATLCRWCDFQTACRIAESRAAAEGAEEGAS